MNKPTDIQWDLPAGDIEKKSFEIIEAEAPHHSFTPEEWRVARRLIHTTADFSIVETLRFNNNPIQSGLEALRNGAPLYSDSNMIRSGISIPRLKQLNDSYERESIICRIADPEIAEEAQKKNISRALCSMEQEGTNLSGAIVLIGNAPLALASLTRFIKERGIKPALVIGMPVGFVNVVESKNLLCECDVPFITLEGRRGGSPLAVATLHAIIESA